MHVIKIWAKVDRERKEMRVSIAEKNRKYKNLSLSVWHHIMSLVIPGKISIRQLHYPTFVIFDMKRSLKNCNSSKNDSLEQNRLIRVKLRQTWQKEFRQLGIILLTKNPLLARAMKMWVETQGIMILISPCQYIIKRPDIQWTSLLQKGATTVLKKLLVMELLLIKFPKFLTLFLSIFLKMPHIIFLNQNPKKILSRTFHIFPSIILNKFLSISPNKYLSKILELQFKKYLNIPLSNLLNIPLIKFHPKSMKKFLNRTFIKVFNTPLSIFHNNRYLNKDINIFLNKDIRKLLSWPPRVFLSTPLSMLLIMAPRLLLRMPPSMLLSRILDWFQHLP